MLGAEADEDESIFDCSTLRLQRSLNRRNDVLLHTVIYHKNILIGQSVASERALFRPAF